MRRRARHERSSDVPASDTTLEEIERWVWDRLETGATDRRDVWHLMALATVAGGGDGGGPGGVDGDGRDAVHPEVRMVVLRRCDRDARTLLAHTDVRSSKCEQIGARPRVGVLLYDAERRVQVRIGAGARVHASGAVADRQWDGSQLMSRRCYLAPVAPGTPSDRAIVNLPDDLVHGNPDAARSEDGRVNFAVVEIGVEWIDWLHLAHDGHRRARFVYSNAGSALHDADGPHTKTSTWIAP
ncbi:MAG: pyridoxamine 5'-phosphate oxidase family protein [Phycisphaerales bacterium]